MNLVIANEQSPLIVHGQPQQTTATNNRDKQPRQPKRAGGLPRRLVFFWRRRWDSNPRKVALHTLSKRADSAALALLQKCLLHTNLQRRELRLFRSAEETSVWNNTTTSGCLARWLGPTQRDPREPGQGGNAAALSEANWCRRQPGRRAGQPDFALGKQNQIVWNGGQFGPNQVFACGNLPPHRASRCFARNVAGNLSPQIYSGGLRRAEHGDNAALNERAKRGPVGTAAGHPRWND